MSARTLIPIIMLTLLPFAALAQGFAGLGTQSDGFSTPQRGVPLQFPADHGPHSDYRIEWWYVTANLLAADGTPYGVQWTLFRTALAPEDGDGWSSPQLWMGHAALTSATDHFVAERLARGGIGQAGATALPFDVWIDEWQLSGTFDAPRMAAKGRDFAYDLQLTADGPIVLHGDNGYSVKSSAGQASYYYSQPFYQVAGTVTLPTGDVAVTGHAWLDREWSSQPLAADQTGWDWFSLSFDDGSKLMAFQLRGTDLFTSGTWITADGAATPLPNGAIQVSPLPAQQPIPTIWRLLLDEKDIDITIKALNPNAWMDTSVPYWEGPVTVSGTHKGVGYLEMTGYSR